MNADQFKPSAFELSQCALRELRRRRRTFPALVRHGKMEQEDAEREIELMQQIFLNLENQTQLLLL